MLEQKNQSPLDESQESNADNLDPPFPHRLLLLLLVPLPVWETLRSWELGLGLEMHPKSEALETKQINESCEYHPTRSR